MGNGHWALPGHLLTRPGRNRSHGAELGSLSDAHTRGLVPDSAPTPGPEGELSPAVPGGFGHGRPLHAGAARLRLRAGGARGAAASPTAAPGPAQRQLRYHPARAGAPPGSATLCLGHPHATPGDLPSTGLSSCPLLSQGGSSTGGGRGRLCPSRSPPGPPPRRQRWR